jgi:hypothetical protein
MARNLLFVAMAFVAIGERSLGQDGLPNRAKEGIPWKRD